MEALEALTVLQEEAGQDDSNIKVKCVILAVCEAHIVWSNEGLKRVLLRDALLYRILILFPISEYWGETKKAIQYVECGHHQR